MHLKRRCLPGEMEQVILQKKSFTGYPGITSVTVKTEEA
jgi:hypothetical protein